MLSITENLLVQDRLRKYIPIFWGTLLLSLTAQISIPLKPIPITLQTIGILLLALNFNRRSAIQSVLTYLTLGALGAPIFANAQGGILILLGSTGGYLMGFLIAVAVMGSLKEYLPKKNFFYLGLNCLIGTSIIFAFGIIWLSKFVGFKAAIQLGFLPFIIPGLIKILLLASATRYINRK